MTLTIIFLVELTVFLAAVIYCFFNINQNILEMLGKYHSLEMQIFCLSERLESSTQRGTTRGETRPLLVRKYVSLDRIKKSTLHSESAQADSAAGGGK